MLIYSKQSFPMSNKKQGLDKGKGMHNSILFEKYINGSHFRNRICQKHIPNDFTAVCTLYVLILKNNKAQEIRN